MKILSKAVVSIDNPKGFPEKTCGCVGQYFWKCSACTMLTFFPTNPPKPPYKAAPSFCANCGAKFTETGSKFGPHDHNLAK